MSLDTIQDIERAIGTLSPQQLAELYAWLDQHYPEPVDARLPSDLTSGRLDAAIRHALDDETNGRVHPL